MKIYGHDCRPVLYLTRHKPVIHLIYIKQCMLQFGTKFKFYIFCILRNSELDINVSERHRGPVCVCVLGVINNKCQLIMYSNTQILEV